MLIVQKRVQHIQNMGWVELNWLFNVTINDISVIYVTAHTCAGGLKKKLDLRSGSQRHRHFVGFFNVPVLAPTRTNLFIRWFRHTAPFSRLLRSRWGYGGAHSRLNPPGPHGGSEYGVKIEVGRDGRDETTDTCSNAAETCAVACFK